MPMASEIPATKRGRELNRKDARNISISGCNPQFNGMVRTVACRQHHPVYHVDGCFLCQPASQPATWTTWTTEEPTKFYYQASTFLGNTKKNERRIQTWFDPKKCSAWESRFKEFILEFFRVLPFDGCRSTLFVIVLKYGVNINIIIIISFLCRSWEWMAAKN